MVSLKLFTMMFLVLCLTHQKITLQQLALLQKNQLSSGDLIEVVESAQSRSIQTLSRDYYTLKVVYKQKRKAYDHMNLLFKRVLLILKKNKVIPHENSLVKSKIKPQYLSKKRKWSFSMIFVIFGTQKELSRCFSQLSKYGIQRLVTRPSINFLNEKMLALQVFSSAKAKLEKQLSRFDGFKISEVEQIQIEGRQISNSDILQNQIQEEFSQSEEQIIDEGNFKGNSQNKQKLSLVMRVVFRVGQQSQEESEEFYEQVEQNSQNSQDNSDDQSM